MPEFKLDGQNFDQYLTLAEKAHRDDVVASNDAFVAAMQKAVRRGREKAIAGTYIDNTPSYGARRIRGDVLMSVCGSPAAMCMEEGGAASGAEAMK